MRLVSTRERGSNRSQAISARLRLCPLPHPPCDGGSPGRATGGRRPLCCCLCRCLCRNPAIPAGVWLSLAVSFRHTKRAANMPKTSMNTASVYHSRFLGVASYKRGAGFDTVEVGGSNPPVPTTFQRTYKESGEKTRARKGHTHIIAHAGYFCKPKNLHPARW